MESIYREATVFEVYKPNLKPVTFEDKNTSIFIPLVITMGVTIFISVWVIHDLKKRNKHWEQAVKKNIV
jgi:membrane protein YdbS with pleckstrin-like domain